MESRFPTPTPLRTGGTAAVLDDGARKVLRQTWMLLALTMVPTVIGAALGVATAPWAMQHLMMLSVVMIVGAIGLQFAIARFRDSLIGVGLLFALTFLLGWYLGPLLNFALSMRNGPQLIGLAGAGTGAILVAMSTIAMTTKRDLSGMGRFLVIGMFVLLALLVANMFLQLPALAMAVSALVIVVFSLFLLHDVNRIVRGGETNYLLAATGVYMSLFNIFSNLLSLLLAFGGERD
jgi:modulator of FtsH protease